MSRLWDAVGMGLEGPERYLRVSESSWPAALVLHCQGEDRASLEHIPQSLIWQALKSHNYLEVTLVKQEVARPKGMRFYGKPQIAQHSLSSWCLGERRGDLAA